MAQPSASTGYAFPGLENLHNDIYPSISASSTPSLHQPGKVVLITGATRGIGRAISVQYAHAGVASIILCARDPQKLVETEAEIKSINAAIRVHSFALSVTDESAVAQCAKDVAQKEGKLHVLINNAGASADWIPLVESEPATWWDTWEVNVKGPYLMLHAFLPLLVDTAKETGKTVDVLNMTSIGAHTLVPGGSAYESSKLALLRLTEFVDVEYGDKGVNVVSVYPGGVVTDMAVRLPMLKPLLIDTPELCGGFMVWLTAEARTWLAGRYLAAPWDVEKLESMKEEIVQGDKLKVRMVV